MLGVLQSFILNSMSLQCSFYPLSYFFVLFLMQTLSSTFASTNHEKFPRLTSMVIKWKFEKKKEPLQTFQYFNMRRRGGGVYCIIIGDFVFYKKSTRTKNNCIFIENFFFSKLNRIHFVIFQSKLSLNTEILIKYPMNFRNYVFILVGDEFYHLFTNFACFTFFSRFYLFLFFHTIFYRFFTDFFRFF